ncbi:response regulator transcription factor [Brachybacterium sp. J144]|uniref:response regulator transcription factor n=1 Tax=Brachybacterium sp. J144 TaxID=3116487 RepID=UPI002E7A0FB9|nr:response regulator transcription factor [Brachybacterium sp. J144]MEE1651058.1 response regulator transcription factor [Brachybacterium sp. J144]
MIRILLSDDHAIVRRGLLAVLAAEEDLEVVAEAATAAEALLLARSVHPDVVLLDLSYGAGSVRGTEIIAELVALDPPPAVLVLTTYDNDQDVTAAMDAGARGYLLKDSPAEELVTAVRRARTEGSALDPRISRRLQRRGGHSLSSRELEVLPLVAAGRTNAAIASDLFLSQATVKTHLVHIFDKLGVTSRTEAVARARAEGMLRPE